MKKIILCFLLFTLFTSLSTTSASEMESKVGIEFSSDIKEEKKEEPLSKRMLPNTNEVISVSRTYTLIGIVILGSLVFFKSENNRKKGEL